ncbi:hypothetical protein BaRGS_00028797 [Batillaria attramentaria]|uniref:Uncharacterized protein n=1 Tax=Batillaria attramentaria TaxID=370345 RepID=A0ABD0JZ31_9CAEN
MLILFQMKVLSDARNSSLSKSTYERSGEKVCRDFGKATKALQPFSPATNIRRKEAKAIRDKSFPICVLQ